MSCLRISPFANPESATEMLLMNQISLIRGMTYYRVNVQYWRVTFDLHVLGATV